MGILGVRKVGKSAQKIVLASGFFWLWDRRGYRWDALGDDISQSRRDLARQLLKLRAFWRSGVMLVKSEFRK